MNVNINTNIHTFVFCKYGNKSTLGMLQCYLVKPYKESNSSVNFFLKERNYALSFDVTV